MKVLDEGRNGFSRKNILTEMYVYALCSITLAEHVFQRYEAYTGLLRCKYGQTVCSHTGAGTQNDTKFKK